MENPRISQLQFRQIIISSVSVTGHLLIVPIVFSRAGRDGWLSLPIAIIVGLITASLLATLGREIPGKSLIEISCSIMGKAIGKIIGMIYVGYFILVSSLTLAALMAFMSSVYMPETPRLAFGFFFLLVCTYAVLLGLETFLRANEMIMPFLIISGILISVIVLPSKDYKNLLPIMEHGLDPIFRGSIPLIVIMAEIVVIGMIQPALNKPPVLKKANIVAVLIIGILFVGPLTGPIALFGAELAMMKVYPTYDEINYVSIATLGNLQPLAIVLWLGGCFGRISLFYYAASIGAAQVFDITNYINLVIPIGVTILIIAAIAFPDVIVIREFLSGSYSFLSISLGIILPVILLGITRIKRHSSYLQKKKS